MSARPELVGICFVDAETFWWDATDSPVCPMCVAGETGYDETHGYFVPRAGGSPEPKAEAPRVMDGVGE